jgi:uncharacterized protein (DUF433 family)
VPLGFPKRLDRAVDRHGNIGRRIADRNARLSPRSWAVCHLERSQARFPDRLSVKVVALRAIHASSVARAVEHLRETVKKTDNEIQRDIPMQSEYVEICDGAYYLTGSRVSLASIVYEYRDGAAPETIRQNFPTLTLEQIHGAIAFYLGHREQVETYLRELDSKWEELEHTAKPVNPELQRRVEEAKKRLLTKQA